MGNRIRWYHRFPHFFTQRMDAKNFTALPFHGADVFSQVDGAFWGERFRWVIRFLDTCYILKLKSQSLWAQISESFQNPPWKWFIGCGLMICSILGWNTPSCWDMLQKSFMKNSTSMPMMPLSVWNNHEEPHTCCLLHMDHTTTVGVSLGANAASFLAKRRFGKVDWRWCRGIVRYTC